MMLGAIYAWRRNGAAGWGWPRSERSDAIMDLRAASRNSNCFSSSAEHMSKSKATQRIKLQARSLARLSFSAAPCHGNRIVLDPGIVPSAASHGGSARPSGRWDRVDPSTLLARISVHFPSSEGLVAPVKSITVCAKRSGLVCGVCTLLGQMQFTKVRYLSSEGRCLFH
ncbi:hypothetical protein BJV74DRAFT_215817 [Russula compacta]|nr:hypothetical protein BJV74DRAFT_215817 [Russula compacta]